MAQLNLNLNQSTRSSIDSYARRELPELPSFAGLEKVSIDAETDLRPNHQRVPYGWAWATPNGRKGYVSIRHPDSVNYDEEAVRRWLKAELAGKKLVVANGKHESYVLQNDGVDPEALGCTMWDVFHQAALLNEKRRTLNLDGIAREELGRGKLELGDTAAYPIHERPAEEVAAYAINDAELALALDGVYEPRIKAEGLETVLQLENDLVYSTVEMERNGAFIDVDLCARWIAEVRGEYEARLFAIHKATGLRVNPNSGPDMEKLFAHLKIENPYLTETGKSSFTEEVMVQFEHPVAQLALEARQLSSLLTKYLVKYLNAVDHEGRLRYQLHQLRGDEGGTITGRYSSSGYDGNRVNVQQVSENSKQPPLLQRWPVRQLFIPPKGEVWVSSDASQIEYRLFAHYAAAAMGLTRLVEAYAKDPNTDFHALVVEWTGLVRGFAKNVNFCKLYGGGVEKIVATINTGIRDKSKQLTLDQGYDIVRKYEREFPEANRLLYYASGVAENRGFVRTFLGRRRRYEPGDRFYSALNSILQGTAGDIVKRKVLETHRARKKLGLTPRITMHDEKDGTSANPNVKAEFDGLLNEQTTPLKVPILWKTGTGANWHAAK
jgi:Mesyanzhinovviridae DNA polymerase